MPPSASVGLRRPELNALLLTLPLAAALLFAVSLWQSGQTSAQEVQTPSQVFWSSSPPTVSITLHAHGPTVNWAYDVMSQTPTGWELVGFHLYRWVPSQPDVLTFTEIATNLSVTTSSYQDSMGSATDEQRTGGTVFEYYVIPVFERLSDRVSQIGTTGAARFTVPALPKPNNLTLNFGWGLSGPHTRPMRMSWSHPHLAWDSASGFDRVTEYQLFQNGRYRFAVSGTNTALDFEAERCERGFQIRVRYGVFYSELADPADQRSGCRRW
ncbi:MAG: hypothetical protein OXG27_02910 [Chloroflexi bacterium]|nr:hypothetical protein [Chloroflexota bacterium]